MSQVQGAFGLLDFTLLGAFSLGDSYQTYEQFISVIFKFFFSGLGKPRILNQRIWRYDYINIYIVGLVVQLI
jgi:hypothetical protein